MPPKLHLVLSKKRRKVPFNDIKIQKNWLCADGVFRTPEEMSVTHKLNVIRFCTIDLMNTAAQFKKIPYSKVARALATLSPLIGVMAAQCAIAGADPFEDKGVLKGEDTEYTNYAPQKVRPMSLLKSGL